MLNLPRVTGWGTDTIANTLMKKSADDRDRETERTRMLGNAILQSAQKGNATEEGFAVLDKLNPALGATARKTNERATSERAQADKENKLKMSNMMAEKTAIAQRISNEDFKHIQKLIDAGDTDNARILVEKINAKYKAMGIDVNLQTAYDSATMKAEMEKGNVAFMNKAIKAAEEDPTADSISSARNTFTTLGNSFSETYTKVFQNRLAAVERKVKAKEDLEVKKVEELRKRDAEIAKEGRTQKIKMTNPKNGRTVDVLASQQAQFEKAGWELGGRSEDKPDTVVNVGNIETKISAEEAAKNVAYLKSPKFRADTIREVSVSDEYKLAATKKEKDTMLRNAAEVSVKNQYPDARYGEFGGKKGFFTIGKSGKPELIAPWN